MYYEIEEEINKSDLMTKFNKIVTYIFFIMIIVCALLYLIGIFFIVLKIEISAVYNISIAILFLMFIASLLVSTKVFYNVHKETINLLNEKRNMMIDSGKIKDKKILKTKICCNFFGMCKLLSKLDDVNGFEISILFDNIKKNGINSNKALDEAIRYYQYKATTSKNFSIGKITIAALFINLIGLLFGNKLLSDIATMILAFGLFFLLFVITYIIYYFYKRGFQPFTKKTYYEKIFLRLSEIRALNLFEKRSKKSKSTKEIITAESTVKAKLTKTK